MSTKFTSAFTIKSLKESGVFVGYASVFNVVDLQRDMVLPGAFKTSVGAKAAQVKLLWQHQWDEPIGKVLRLFEDARGLYVEAQLLLQVARAREAYSLLQEGVLNGLSIGYTPKKYRVDPDSGVRKLSAIDLFEISLVTLPANPHAVVTVVKGADDVALMGLQKALRQATQALRY
jgi:uncharacterized protein